MDRQRLVSAEKASACSSLVKRLRCLQPVDNLMWKRSGGRTRRAKIGKSRCRSARECARPSGLLDWYWYYFHSSLDSIKNVAHCHVLALGLKMAFVF